MRASGRQCLDEAQQDGPMPDGTYPVDLAIRVAQGFIRQHVPDPGTRRAAWKAFTAALDAARRADLMPWEDGKASTPATVSLAGLRDVMLAMLGPVLAPVSDPGYLDQFEVAKARLVEIDAREERAAAPDDGLCENCKKPRPPRARYTCGSRRCLKARSRRLAREAGKVPALA